MASATESLTPQGRAIKTTVLKFGSDSDGTLSYPCCKKGFRPLSSDGSKKMLACYLHDKLRRLRCLTSDEEVLFGQLWMKNKRNNTQMNEDKLNEAS